MAGAGAALSSGFVVAAASYTTLSVAGGVLALALFWVLLAGREARVASVPAEGSQAA